ncbi:MAG: TlpA family protein disulfide reductase [Saccharofermentanales bacterium]|nr:TlpA family protein disulfide reductase [Clostridiaceae bacterium]
MTPKTKTLIWIVAFIALITVAYFAYGGLSKANKPEPTNPTATQKDLISAPDFVVYAADGTEHRLSDYRGRPVVLNFWASWCPPCRQEMPHFDRVYREVKDDVMFMMVDLVDGQREKQTDGQEYIDLEGFTFPVFFDTDRDAARVYGITSIPSTLFIDKDGFIAYGYRGGIDESTLRAGIKAILPES